MLAGLLVAVGTLMLATLPLAWLTVAFAVMMFGSTLGQGPTQALLIGSSSGKTRGSAMASPYFLPSLAGVPMPVLGSIGAQALGWPMVLGAGSALAFVATGVLALRLPREQLELAPDGRGTSQQGYGRGVLVVLATLSVLVLVYALDSFSEGSYMPFMPVYFTKYLGAPVEFYGALSSTYLMCVGGMSFVAGKLIDKAGAVTAMIASFLAEATLVFAILLATNFFTAGVLFVVWEAIDLLDRTAPQIVIGERVEPKRRATALSGFSMVTTLSKLPAPAFGAFLYLISPRVLLAFEGVISIASACIVFLMSRSIAFRQSAAEKAA